MPCTRLSRSACVTSHRHAAHLNSRAWQQRCWPAVSRPACMLKCRASQQQAHSLSEQRPIEVSRSIAAARAAESLRPDALFTDPYAATLSSGSVEQQQQSEAGLMDVIATRYIDESLLNAMAATNVNSIQSGDYRQVVIIGDGMDCRPFRLPWPPGTMLFLVAPAEVHEQAEALLEAAAEPPHVMRGCLLRRVNMNLAAAADVDEGSSSSGTSSSGSSSSAAAAAAEGQVQQHVARSTVLAAQLARAGFRADRLSVWVLQGLHNQGLRRQQLQQLLTEVTNCAAFHSLLVGEIPGPMSKDDAENILAEAGLLGAVYSYGDEGYGRWQQGLQEGDVADRWLCTAQQLRLSLEQMGIYEEWSAEFADADAGDDFIGNFS